MKLGVLTSTESWYYRDLARAAASDHQICAFSMASMTAGVEQSDWVRSAGGASLREMDAVLVRSMPPGSLEQVIFRMDALHRLESTGVLVVNPPRSLEIAVDKYLATAKLRQADLPTPRTIACQTAEDAMVGFDQLGKDVVVKPLFGSEGRGIFRVDDEALALRAFKTLEQLRAVIYLQEFIAHGGFDLRLLVLGDQIFGMRRCNPFDWRTNISRGATAEPLELTTELVDLARRASLAVDTPLAAVDVLPSTTGHNYVLEVNAVPGWKAIGRLLQVDMAAEVLTWIDGQLARRQR